MDQRLIWLIHIHWGAIRSNNLPEGLPSEIAKSVALSRSGLIRNQKMAALNLYRLSQISHDARLHIVYEGGLLPLTAMSKSKSLETQILSLKILGELSKAILNRQSMLENGVSSSLIEALSHSSMDVKRAALLGLENLSSDHHVACQIAREGSILSLIKVIDMNEQSTGRYFGTDIWVIDNVSWHDSQLSALRICLHVSKVIQSGYRSERFGLISSVIKVGKYPLNTLGHKVLALQILSNMCANEVNHKKICDNDGLGYMVKILSDDIEALVAPALEAVERMSMNPVLIRKIGVDLGVLSILTIIMVEGLCW